MHTYTHMDVHTHMHAHACTGAHAHKAIPGEGMEEEEGTPVCGSGWSDEFHSYSRSHVDFRP